MKVVDCATADIGDGHYFGIQEVFEQWKCLGPGKDIFINSKKSFLSYSMEVIEFCVYLFS